MTSFKTAFKRLPFYRDLRQVCMLCANGEHRLANRFLYYRYWVNWKLHQSQQILECPIQTSEYTLHFLCGHSDLSQLIWALASWYRVTQEAPQVFIHDDGTFTQRDRDVIRTFFPSSQIVDYRLANERVSTWLADYPLARQIRTARHPSPPHKIAYPFAIKLIDPYFISNAHNVLLLDTDILWFRKPEELLTAIYQYACPVFWPDTSPAPLFFENGEGLREDLTYYNAGLVYYRKTDLNFSILEEYLLRRGKHADDRWFGFNDQPAYAYTLGQYAQATLLPSERYLCKGQISETTVSTHYLGPIRPMFWAKGVRYFQQQYAVC